MKVCVAGLWRRGCVTAACLTSTGHEVRGFDPVDDDDRADVDGVVRQAAALFPYLSDGTLVMVSSQLPVGSTARDS